MNNFKNHGFKILNFAIDSVKPEQLLNNSISFTDNCLSVKNHLYQIDKFENVYVIGAGKASAFMAIEIEKLFADSITAGVVVTKYNHTTDCKKIRVIEAGHPIVDENSLLATDKVLQLLSKTTKNDLVIFLLSGGGSSLLEKPAPSVLLEDYIQLNKILLNCSADIAEINTVRKKISLIKGGKLARFIYPSECISLIISDVIGDDIASIASGPIYPDQTKTSEIFDIFNKYKITSEIPVSIFNYLETQSAISADMIYDDAIYFENVNHFIIGSNKIALINALKLANQLGYESKVISDKIRGEAKNTAKEIAEITKREIHALGENRKPVCLLFGGETTVTVKGSGKGGRNQEVALSALLEMKDVNSDFLMISCGTDGTDGPTDAAGAYIDNSTWGKVVSQRLHPQEFLDNNDSYNFFDKIKQLIKTGPTGTNVMDIIIVLLK